jgi:genome maintenance exonuclease 1
MFEHVSVDLKEMVAETTESGRVYLTPEGVKFPSITTVLSILSKDGIDAWRKRIGEEEADKIMYRASTRGTSVHEIIEKYLNNEEDYRDGYTPDILQCLIDLKPILDGRVGRIFAQEAPLYSNHLGVAGRVDCVAEFDSKLSIIDFKTSRKPKQLRYIHNYFMQEAAYAIMWEERTGMPITQLVTIIAVDNNPPQVFIEHRDNWVRPLRETIEKYQGTRV